MKRITGLYNSLSLSEKLISVNQKSTYMTTYPLQKNKIHITSSSRYYVEHKIM